MSKPIAIDRNGEPFIPEDDELTPEQIEYLRADNRYFDTKEQFIDYQTAPYREEREKILQEEYDNVSFPIKAGRFVTSMIAPVSTAYAEGKAESGDDREILPAIGAGIADAGLALATPLRLAGAGLKKIAPRAVERAATYLPTSIRGKKAVQGGVNALDNIGMNEGAMALEEVANPELDYGIVEHVAGDAIGGVIGALTGVNRLNRSLKARKELVGSTPQNIRLNEKSGRLIDDGFELGLGSQKQNRSIDALNSVFDGDPNLSLSEAIERNTRKFDNLNAPDYADMQYTHVPMTDPPQRNIPSRVSNSIDEAREELQRDMVTRGYLNEYGVPAHQIPHAFEYLNNVINWNKNQQGIARSAPDEKAARELYNELRNGITAGSGPNPNYERVANPVTFEDNVANMIVEGDAINTKALGSVDNFKRNYADAITERELLSGVASKRYLKPEEYYPFRYLDPNNPFAIQAKEYFSNQGSYRLPKQLQKIEDIDKWLERITQKEDKDKDKDKDSNEVQWYGPLE